MKSTLSLLLLVSMSLAAEHIPNQLRHRLKSVQSLHEFMGVAKLMYTPKKSGSGRHRTLSYGGERRDHSELKIQGASFVALPSTSRTGSQGVVEVDDHLQSDLTILSRIRQGNDTCQLQSVCVPVPVENQDPSVIIFPRCYEVTQCVGSCCDAVESCHPTAVEHLERPIVELMYIGNNKFVINETRNTTVEQHLACSCRDCALEGILPHCSQGRVVGSSCTCECRNQIQKNNCKGNWKWDEERCKCECPLRRCPGDGVLNEKRCECELDSRIIHLEEPDEQGNYRSDISKLPKLRPRVHNHNHGV